MIRGLTPEYRSLARSRTSFEGGGWFVEHNETCRIEFSEGASVDDRISGDGNGMACRRENVTVLSPPLRSAFGGKFRGPLENMTPPPLRRFSWLSCSKSDREGEPGDAHKLFLRRQVVRSQSRRIPAMSALAMEDTPMLGLDRSQGCWSVLVSKCTL
jgi:hypothetical protein